MKVFVVFVLFATVAYASSYGEDASLSSSPHGAEFLAQATQFVGDLQLSDEAPVEHFTPSPPADLPHDGLASPIFHFIPTCRLPPQIGNPICFARCITSGSLGGGRCDGSRCKCNIPH